MKPKHVNSRRQFTMSDDTFWKLQSLKVKRRTHDSSAVLEKVIDDAYDAEGGTKHAG